MNTADELMAMMDLYRILKAMPRQVRDRNLSWVQGRIKDEESREERLGGRFSTGPSGESVWTTEAENVFKEEMHAAATHPAAVPKD